MENTIYKLGLLWTNINYEKPIPKDEILVMTVMGKIYTTSSYIEKGKVKFKDEDKKDKIEYFAYFDN